VPTSSPVARVATHSCFTDFCGAQWNSGRRYSQHDDERSGDLIEIDHDVTGFGSFADILAHATQSNGDTVIDFGNGDSLTLQHVRLNQLQSDSFVFV
jgi:hypothetical protein